jgi:hypothetical protein
MSEQAGDGQENRGKEKLPKGKFSLGDWLFAIFEGLLRIFFETPH